MGQWIYPRPATQTAVQGHPILLEELHSPKWYSPQEEEEEVQSLLVHGCSDQSGLGLHTRRSIHPISSSISSLLLFLFLTQRFSVGLPFFRLALRSLCRTFSLS
jgi:hypothetical protein